MMIKHVILLRGNSGSGKTTTANKLRNTLSGNCLLINQDIVRRIMLAAPDHPNNLSISLLNSLIGWGAQSVEYIIIEGIFKNSVYNPFLTSLHQRFGANISTYYFDLSFEETCNRNHQKSNAFSKEQLTKWWLSQDQLGNETHIFTGADDLNKRIAIILNDINK